MKKPDAITEITPDNYKEKVWPLPASDMIYVGRATEKKLAGYGIHTIGQIAATPPDMLKGWRVNGLALWAYASGVDSSRVMNEDFVSPVKSIGHGITCVADLNNEEEVWRVVLELSQDIGHKLRVHQLVAGGVQITVKNSELSYRQYRRRYHQYARPWNREKARELFDSSSIARSRPCGDFRAIKFFARTATAVGHFTDL